ncbi:MAG: T9SS type A sorting domain-containing protein [Bacteroidetes bacterium]|nr:T9SS type A sorting domain-containing protein [Bacteroidota bacterium]
MKKITFLLAGVLLLIFSTRAQITITSSNMPVVNTYEIDVIDTFCTGVSIGNAGASQSWNLSNIATSYVESSNWVLPSSLAGASLFPTATLANTNTDGSRDTYLKLSSTALEMQGFYGSFPIIGIKYAVFNPTYKYVQFPSTYQTSYNGTYGFDVKAPFTQLPLVDSVKLNISTNYNVIVDGWGTVTTPASSNLPCLRQKNATYTIVTIYAHSSITGWAPYGTPQKDTTIDYIWFSNQKNFIIADIETDANGALTKATYLQSSGNGVGVSDGNQYQNKIGIYPNPVKDNINIINVPQNSVILVFDMNGKIVATKLIMSSRTSLNISALKDGMYIYQIFNKNSEVLDTGKFSVIK